MKKIKNNITELVFILDRSGSMSGLEADTIGGFNSMIEKQKKLDGKVYVSTVGESKCVLTELYPDVTHTEAQKVVTTMLAAGWTPIFAHVERYPNLFEKCHIEDLIAAGAMIRVNLYMTPILITQQYQRVNGGC